MPEKQFATYEIVCEGVSVTINIVGQGKRLRYYVAMPQFELPTLALIDGIKSKLIMELDISNIEVFDQVVIDKLKVQFKKRAAELILTEIPTITKDSKHHMISRLIREMLGLGDIEFLLSDENLEEIVINDSLEYIRVYHKKFGWLESNLKLESENQILNYSNIIARRVGRQISTLTPLLDAHLVSGDRANSVLFPISGKGNTLTIRKFARDPWTVVDLIKNSTVSVEIFALLWLAIEYEMNIIISGGTAAGKTSILNICMAFLPPNHRVISIEDTRELQLPSHLFWTPLTTREPNVEGKGKVGMIDLLINSLRMRPDRIILGEMRKQEEAEVMFEAMHTGHSVYATVHADSISETIRRLINPPINTPANLLDAVDLNLVMFRDRRRGIRRALQIGEFVVSDEGGRINVKPNMLYRWDPNKDKMVEHSPSVKLYDKLATHTGMDNNEIQKDLKQKQEILNWLVKNNIRDIHNVGQAIADYYLDKDALMDRIKKNILPTQFMGSTSKDENSNVVIEKEKLSKPKVAKMKNPFFAGFKNKPLLPSPKKVPKIKPIKKVSKI